MQSTFFKMCAALAAIAFSLSGCVTTSGTYVLTATDSTGQQVAPGQVMMAQGSALYSVRNGICIAHPKAVVVIRDATTGQELKGESPYQCR